MDKTTDKGAADVDERHNRPIVNLTITVPCPDCRGQGSHYERTEEGSRFPFNINKCERCNGDGFINVGR